MLNMKSTEKQYLQISAAQVRAGRGLLGWSQEQLAEAAGITKSTLALFEVGRSTPYERTRTAIKRALEGGGVRFFSGDGVSLGADMQYAKALSGLKVALAGVACGEGDLHERVANQIGTIRPVRARDFPEDLVKRWEAVCDTFRACSQCRSGADARPPEDEVAAMIADLIALIEALACLK